MKPFTVSIVREIFDPYDRGERSYTKVVELLNERVNNYLIEKNKKVKCYHSNIECVTEHPTDGKICQADKTYVRCEDCGELLNIDRISVRTINVKLY